MKPKAVLTESSHRSESVASTNSGVHMESRVAGGESRQHPQQTSRSTATSAVADARSKFEQVLQASKQAAAAGGGGGDAAVAVMSASADTHCHKKPLTTAADVAAPHCQKPENGLMSRLLYNQSVFTTYPNIMLLF